tara:strand:- start:114 stop:458 length:345 start_codon:yes stop_codon:yes gene_type:complete
MSIGKAILKINPNAEFSVNGDLYDLDRAEIFWDEGTTPISKEDIKARLPEALFDEALAWLREDRNRLLQETDFYALPDVTMSDEMRTYRQKLRDITDGVDTMDKLKAVKFPTKP